MKPNNYKLNRLAPEHQHMKTYHHTHSLNRHSPLPTPLSYQVPIFLCYSILICYEPPSSLFKIKLPGIFGLKFALANCISIFLTILLFRLEMKMKMMDRTAAPAACSSLTVLHSSITQGDCACGGIMIWLSGISTRLPAALR